MVAHLLPKQRVAGSNPVSRSTIRAAHRQTPLTAQWGLHFCRILRVVYAQPHTGGVFSHAHSDLLFRSRLSTGGKHRASICYNAVSAAV